MDPISKRVTEAYEVAGATAERLAAKVEKLEKRVELLEGMLGDCSAYFKAEGSLEAAAIIDNVLSGDLNEQED